MIVPDTCVIVHLFNETQLTSLAQKVRNKDAAWLIPPLWQEEYANVISKRARKESRNVHSVLEHYELVLEELGPCEIWVEPKKALEISMECKISVYDAHFVALALEYKIPLVTEDQEILKHCKTVSVSMHDFLNSSLN